jgi:hypothetical protein
MLDPGSADVTHQADSTAYAAVLEALIENGLTRFNPPPILARL